MIQDDKYVSRGGARVDSILYANKNKPFVKRILTGSRNVRYNEKFGVKTPASMNRSTHLMSSASDDKSPFAYPTLQYKTDMFGVKYWKENRNPRDAMRSGNIIRFKTDEEASRFAEGAWKPKEGFGVPSNKLKPLTRLLKKNKGGILLNNK